jgi:cell wall-associated NlpC family hydrolase
MWSRVVVLCAVSLAAIYFAAPAYAEEPSIGGYAAVYRTDGEGLRLRSDIWSTILQVLPEGTAAKVLFSTQDLEGATWYKVEARAQVGWVYGYYLKAISREEAERRIASDRGGLRSRVVDIALQYQGYRYVWGGASPQQGFDSSGYLYYVFRAAGLPIPRDYWGMLARGKPVTLNQLRPGDLVFFVNTYKAGLSHGGIYIGNGRFIHAVSEKRGVAIDSIWRSYYINRFYAARRID